MNDGRYRQISVDIEREAFDAVDQLAQAEGVARPDILRIALNLLLEQKGLAVRCIPTAAPYEGWGRRRRRPVARGVRFGNVTQGG